MQINARSRLNVALIAVAAALGLIAYLKPGHRTQLPNPPLIPLKAADVKDIKIAAGNAAPVVLHRAAGGWQLTAPIEMRADDALVQRMLQDLDVSSDRDFPAAAGELSKYGLNPPNLRLWFNGLEVDFGDPEPLDNDLYARVGGSDQVHLVSARLYYQTQHDAYGWADKHLLPPGAHIVALQLPEATLSLDGSGRWQLAPRDDAVSADAIQHVVDDWQHATALGITATGKQSPAGEVAVLLLGATTLLRFQILKDDDFLVLGRPDLGLQYQLDQSQRAELLEFARTAAPAAGTAHPAPAHR